MDRRPAVQAVREWIDRRLTAWHLRRYKEQLLYILVGGGTTAVDWVLYTVFVLFLPVLPVPALQRLSPNFLAYLVSWAGAVTFSYVLSRLFVFESTDRRIAGELGKFVLSRLFTLAVSLGADVLFCGEYAIRGSRSPFLVKAAVTVLVIVLNYLTGKLFVFRRKSAGENKSAD